MCVEARSQVSILVVCQLQKMFLVSRIKSETEVMTLGGSYMVTLSHESIQTVVQPVRRMGSSVYF
jgi:hypothetical protein